MNGVVIVDEGEKEWNTLSEKRLARFCGIGRRTGDTEEQKQVGSVASGR